MLSEIKEAEKMMFSKWFTNCMFHAFISLIYRFTHLLIDVPGALFWGGYQSEGEWRWSRCTDLRNQASCVKVPGCLLPEM